jgi:hypothetical protein
MAQADYNTAVGYTVAADVGYGVATVCVAGGVLWWLLRGRSSDTPRTTAVLPAAVRGSGGAIVVVGSF